MCIRDRFISVKALVIGVPLGILINYLLCFIMNRMGGAIIYKPPYKAIILCIVDVYKRQRTSFEFEDGDGVTSANILRIDSRFVSLFKWLGENHIKVQLSGANTPDGYAVYRVCLLYTSRCV